MNDDYNRFLKLRFLQLAQDYDKEAFDLVDGLDLKKYEGVILWAQNNYLCTLIEQREERFNNGSGLDPALQKCAKELQNEFWETIASRKIEKKYPAHVYHWKETCSNALVCFAGNNKEEKEKAIQIINSLKGNSPDGWFKKINEKYQKIRDELSSTSIK